MRRLLEIDRLWLTVAVIVVTLTLILVKTAFVLMRIAETFHIGCMCTRLSE